MDENRLKTAAAALRLNIRRGHRRAGFRNFDGIPLLAPAPGTDLLENVDATADELLAYLSWLATRAAVDAAAVERAATLGLACEMGMHEINSEFHAARTALENAASALKAAPGSARDAGQAGADGTKALGEISHAIGSIERLRSNFAFFTGLKYPAEPLTGRDVMDVLVRMFGRYMEADGVALTATDGFLGTRMPLHGAAALPVFLNLVRNAWYWCRTTDRPRAIRLDAREVTLPPFDPESEVEEDRIPRTSHVITIGDSGPGVPDGMRENIFKPYQTGRGSSGIGLYLCRRALAQRSCAIDLNPEPSPLGGAEFRIGPAEVIDPVPVADPTHRADLLSGALAILSMLSEERSRDVLRIHAETYGDLMREALRIRIEGAADDLDHRLGIAAGLVSRALDGEPVLAQALERLAPAEAHTAMPTSP